MSEGLQYCAWDGRPCVYRTGHAWAFLKGKWEKVDDADVFMSARVMTREKFERQFPPLPPLPKEATG